MLVSQVIDGKVAITITGGNSWRLERKADGGVWETWNGEGFAKLPPPAVTLPPDPMPIKPTVVITPAAAVGKAFLDDTIPASGLYAYRCAPFDKPLPDTDEGWEYSNWVRVAGDTQIGYTFGNYKSAPDEWGEVLTCDDLRYTYLWGTDFKAANGQSYTDAQIKYFIDAALQEMERKLDITIKKHRIRNNAEERRLERGKDYDVDEAVYDFRFAKISRYALIKTRERPILRLHSLRLVNRLQSSSEMKDKVVVDKAKGLLKLLERPLRPSETSMAIQTSIGMYGNQTWNVHLFYAIDYDAGYETAQDVPNDLRQIIGKLAAVSLLNVIGDGLMSGFSSSSLSMDGLSESFSSTQSATSAYFGARIKEYKDDIDAYIKITKQRFGHVAMGAL